MAIQMDRSPRSSSESLHGSENPFLGVTRLKDEHTKPRGCKPSRFLQWSVVFPWSLCLVLCTWLVINEARMAGSICSATTGYWGEYELEPVKSEIPATLKHMRFTGGLKYNESGWLVREIDPTETEYVGIPNPKLDAAWEALVSSTDIFLTKKEIKQMGERFEIPGGNDLYVDRDTGLYQAVPHVFHNLHCLNMIRKAAYLDYYSKDVNPDFWPHIEHCFDTLRQSFMCMGDMTPIPEAWTDFRPHGNLNPIFQNLHTCRDYKAIQKWAKGRDATDPAVWAANAKRLLGG